MRLRGRRLTMVLTVVLIVIVGAGVCAAWALGRTRAVAMPVGYSAGPSADQVVRLSDGVGEHPEAARVQQSFQQYFDAINRRDYESWLRSVAAGQSSAQSADDWLREYSTTVDSNLVVASIQDQPLRARLMFTSEQQVEFAPSRLPVTCINWDLTYLLIERDGALVLSGIDPSAQSMTQCR